jgi:hypothetical protein
VLVPERPLVETVTERAKLVAERQSNAIEHTMRLEDQAVKDKGAARALREQRSHPNPHHPAQRTQ